MGQAKIRGNRDARVQQAIVRQAAELEAANERDRLEHIARKQFADELRAAVPRAQERLELIRQGQHQAMRMVIDETTPLVGAS